MSTLNVSFSDLPLLGKKPAAVVRLLCEAGADGLEILMDGPAWDDPGEAARQLRTVLRTCPVPVSLHPPAWDINLTSENGVIRAASFEAHLAAVRLAHEVGAKHVVVHPGFRHSPAFPLYAAWERAEDALARLVEAARPLGVVLAVENVGYGGESLFTQDEYVVFVERFDSAVTGYLIDTGHALLNGWDLPALLEQAAPRLAGIHLHDNYGDADTHRPVGEGTVAWDGIWRALGALAPDCPLILEYAPGTPLSRLSADRERIARWIAGAGCGLSA
ncbi:sugar phosphate isomerase/epimerase family protein [Desulfotomaculum copahuensis]|uniref:Xylose isomerase-like TIM barrel domain-containing protein n=1 Tax=Desulfotomaculum copahuensis TaxID=1838280 RepID=A0A1B7LF96_9FIRM|nr:sugar phosphate isomerase/epimerase [Desulfotomaculum copahuensis]OAT82310.1 hypothetical protein A6M21_09155 [Desulfotomaculum copahuensis]